LWVIDAKVVYGWMSITDWTVCINQLQQLQQTSHSTVSMLMCAAV